MGLEALGFVAIGIAVVGVLWLFGRYAWCALLEERQEETDLRAEAQRLRDDRDHWYAEAQRERDARSAAERHEAEAIRQLAAESAARARSDRAVADGVELYRLVDELYRKNRQLERDMERLRGAGTVDHVQ